MFKSWYYLQPSSFYIVIHLHRDVEVSISLWAERPHLGFYSLAGLLDQEVLHLTLCGLSHHILNSSITVFAKKKKKRPWEILLWGNNLRIKTSSWMLSLYYSFFLCCAVQSVVGSEWMTWMCNYFRLCSCSYILAFYFFFLLSYVPGNHCKNCNKKAWREVSQEEGSRQGKMCGWLGFSAVRELLKFCFIVQVIQP